MFFRKEIFDMLIRSEALLKGHFQLTSGLHSDTYIQCAKVLQYPRYAEEIGEALASLFQKEKPDVVIGPAMGGVVIAAFVGRALGVRTIFCERVDGQFQLRRGFEIKKGERVLVVEDVLTTGGSARETIELLNELGANVIGAGSIIDRSGGAVKLGVYKESLVTLQVENYDPAECPLCKDGSKAEKPGSRTLTGGKA